MPALEALGDRFDKANTATLGISVDSHFCHANWAVSLGGVSMPLLADFHPKGAIAKAYGVYLDAGGITDRATVIVDAGGVVRHASSVTPAGERDIGELAALCEKIDAAYQGDLAAYPAAPGVGDATLYVRSNCGFSLRALNALHNLHLDAQVKVRNVSDDAGALAKLEEASGAPTAPCLVAGGDVIGESDAIVEHLVTRATGFWGG